MAVEGTLDLFRLPEILQLISQQGKTGILTVQGQQDIVAVSFLNGRIVAADALTQTVEEGLSQVLVSEKLVSAADFSRAAAENQAAGGRLLETLVERGLVTRAKLLEALRLQTRRQLQRLLRWDQGDFKFYSGDEVSYEEGFLPISVEDLLLDSLQDFADTPLRPEAPAPASPRQAGGTPASGGPSPAAVPFAGAPRAGAPAGLDLSEASLPVTKVFPAPPASQSFPIGLPANPAPGIARGQAAVPGALGAGPPAPVAAPPGGAAPAWASPGATAPAWASPGAAVPETGTRPLRVVRSQGAPRSASAAGSPGSPSGAPARPRTGPSEPPLTPPSPATADQPLPRQFRKMELARSRERLPAGDVAAALLLGVLLAGGIAVAMVRKPASLTVPFPWQGSERAALTQDQQQALYAKIDRGAKTFFLLEGRFPDRLQQLAAMGLLSPGDFEDAERRPLEYLPREESYSVRPLAGGRPLAELETSGSVSGNFLLDPQLLVPAPAAVAPIVLLD
jgi:hypothetical protein